MFFIYDYRINDLLKDEHGKTLTFRNEENAAWWIDNMTHANIEHFAVV